MSLSNSQSEQFRAAATSGKVMAFVVGCLSIAGAAIGGLTAVAIITMSTLIMMAMIGTALKMLALMVDRGFETVEEVKRHNLG